MSTPLTFWDHVTLMGAVAIVIGYIVFRIRIALDPKKGGCSGCGCGDDGGGCGGAAPHQNCAEPPTEGGINLLKHERS